MLTTIATVIFTTSVLGAILVSSMRSARPSYARLIAVLICCALICIGLDVAAWSRHDGAAALLLLASAAVLLGLGWQQSARLREDLEKSRGRYLQARKAHDVLRHRHR